MNHAAGVTAARFDGPGDAEGMLRQVIERATQHQRPLLIACAQRDLAQLLVAGGDFAGATRMAHAARATFEELGARVEIEKLEALLGGLRGNL